jgi:hypothetical protein
VLRASAQLLRPGGRIAFFTIEPVPGLSPGRRRRAHRDGPVAVAVSRPHRELLDRAGFTDIDESDHTADFATVARAWIDQTDQHRDELAAVLGGAQVDQRQLERRAQMRAIDDGLLRRTLYSATRQGGG